MLAQFKIILAAIQGKGSWLAAILAILELLKIGASEIPVPSGPQSMDLIDERDCITTLQDYVDASCDPTTQAAFAIPWRTLVPFLFKLLNDFLSGQKILPK